MSKIIELDVRLLSIPEPMQKTLVALKELQNGEIIHFWHRMTPDMLFPYLDNYYYEMQEDDEIHIYICNKNDSNSILEIQQIMKRQ